MLLLFHGRMPICSFIGETVSKSDTDGYKFYEDDMLYGSGNG